LTHQQFEMIMWLRTDRQTDHTHTVAIPRYTHVAYV